jgi:hypothetical protein
MQGSVKTIGLAAVVAAFGIQGLAHGQSVFTVHKQGSFYHALSTQPHAYDLEADVRLLGSDPDARKDFVNTDVQGTFDGKWKAGNTTTFVNAPGWPTFNAQTGSVDFTFAKVDSLYKAGTPVTAQDKPGTGSKHVWITKLRGSDTYVIVKFLSIIGNDNTCNCANQGVTSFEYWKMPASGVAPPTSSPPACSSMADASPSIAAATCPWCYRP